MISWSEEVVHLHLVVGRIRIQATEGTPVRSQASLQFYYWVGYLYYRWA